MMPDYQNMYRELFIAQTKAIDALKQVQNCLVVAQQKTEEMYINADEPKLVVLKSPKSRRRAVPEQKKEE